MAFTNNINKKTLKKALINWVLGTDGNDGATEYVMDEIPWSDDMGLDFWRNEVNDKIDEAIGSRYDNGKHWDVTKLVEYADSYIENISYRHRFYFFIDKKVEDIYNTYQEAIDKLNAKKELYYWTLDCDSYSERSEKNFESKEDCYEDMRRAVNKKVLWNINYTDFASENDTIDINITATRNQIECQSYSGTYTWEIHSCFK